MVIKNMDSTGNLHTSTPLQCRHDSGYGSNPKDYRLLEFSPIRKLPDMQQAEGNLKYIKNSDKLNPKRLFFCNSFYGFIGDNSESDSGIGSYLNESVSENNSLPCKNSQCAKDENSNFTCLVDSLTESEHQPSKYICKDHSHEKSIFGKCKRDVESKIFKSYAIASELFKAEKKNNKVDFLYELDIRNCSSIISDILSYLSDEDLRQVNNVNKRWQDIVSSDNKANNRRTFYINNKKNAARGPNKENKFKVASVERDHKSAFKSLANLENDTKQPIVYEIIQGRFDSFLQEQKIDGNQTLLKCPKCRYPARANTEFKYCCTRNLCKYEFCKECLGPFFDNHKCSVPELNNALNIVVGSKKSRKNLRRLKA